MKKKKILICLFIFVFSFAVRFWNINAMGRTWDELFYTEQGYKMLILAEKRDFLNFFWIKDPDSPVLSKYFYALAASFDIKSFKKNHDPIFKYDLFYTRLVSVLFGSLTAVFVTVIGIIYFSPFIGLSSGIIFSLIPTVLGLNQRVTIESVLIFFFTVCIFVFLRLLEYPSLKKSYLFGLLLGLNLIIKYSNVILIPLCLLLYLIWIMSKKRKERKVKISGKAILIFCLGFITFILIWPQPWLNLKYMIHFEYSFRFAQNSSPWEWFFGLPVHVPWYYYIIHFIIRTPFLLIILSLIGLKVIDKERKFIYFAIMAWFIFPFIQSFYHFRMQGVRYIAQVYVPFSLLVAFGLNWFAKRFSLKNWLVLFVLTIYLFVILAGISPYYLDYFNILTGGAKNIYNNNFFDIGWWGEGGKEAGDYLISHAKKTARIGYMLDPFSALELSDSLKYFPFHGNEKYDYVVTNFFEYQKIGYNSFLEKNNYESIQKNYKLVYTVYADGAELYHVYKSK